MAGESLIGIIAVTTPVIIVAIWLFNDCTRTKTPCNVEIFLDASPGFFWLEVSYSHRFLCFQWITTEPYEIFSHYDSWGKRNVYKPWTGNFEEAKLQAETLLSMGEPVAKISQ